MSELIDREAMKDAVKQYADEPIKKKDRKCQAICLDMIGTIDAQPTASPWHRVEEPPKWVSVFDDLPRHNAVVVVSDGKRSWDVGQYHFLFKADDRTIWWWKKHTTRKVLWWMYKEDAIPEPPKEDEDADN